jgi:hypothetical protein
MERTLKLYSTNFKGCKIYTTILITIIIANNNNSILNLFTCLLSNLKANYKVSMSKEVTKETHAHRQRQIKVTCTI